MSQYRIIKKRYTRASSMLSRAIEGAEDRRRATRYLFQGKGAVSVYLPDIVPDFYPVLRKGKTRYYGRYKLVKYFLSTTRNVVQI